MNEGRQRSTRRTRLAQSGVGLNRSAHKSSRLRRGDHGGSRNTAFLRFSFRHRSGRPRNLVTRVGRPFVRPASKSRGNSVSTKTPTTALWTCGSQSRCGGVFRTRKGNLSKHRDRSNSKERSGGGRRGGSRVNLSSRNNKGCGMRTNSQAQWKCIKAIDALSPGRRSRTHYVTVLSGSGGSLRANRNNGVNNRGGIRSNKTRPPASGYLLWGFIQQLAELCRFMRLRELELLQRHPMPFLGQEVP